MSPCSTNEGTFLSKRIRAMMLFGDAEMRESHLLNLKLEVRCCDQTETVIMIGGKGESSLTLMINYLNLLPGILRLAEDH